MVAFAKVNGVDNYKELLKRKLMQFCSSTFFESIALDYCP
jgi:hypothetical protein